jgi:hypothetical protein
LDNHAETAPVFPERGSLKGQEWLCSYAENFKPCHTKAAWLIQKGELLLGACSQHRDLVRAQLVPEIHVWEMKWLVHG